MYKLNKNSVKNRVKLKICGVNLKRLIKNIYKSDIEIYNLNLISPKELEITINSNKLHQIKPLIKDYKFSITKRYGLSFLNNFSLTHIGLVIGLIIFVAVNFLSSKMLYNINIVGTDKIENNEIIKILSENGIKTGKFIGNLNTESIEKTLENSFDRISFVSVLFKGNSLLINIKEKLFVEELESSSNIIAPENGIITKINVVQGTSNLKIGDIVKKGEVIVEGKMNGNSCLAIADVELKIWYTSSKTILNEETKTVRTSKSFENSYFSIFNNDFKIKEQKNPYTLFETETKESYIFKNNIVPVKLKKKIFYELKEIVVKNDFNLLKHDIIEETTTHAKSLVPSSVEISNVFTEIVESENQKIVTTFVETFQKIS